jgi:integrase
VRGTKKDAERRLRELLVSVETGGYVNPTSLTVGEWLDQWCESYAKMHTTPRTAESYQAIIRHHLSPALGALPLTQLKPHHLQGYYARALSESGADGKSGLSSRTVLYHHRILAEALDHALKMGLVARNVADAVDPPRPPRPAITTLAPDDIPKLFAAAENTPYHDVFYTALYTGLRLGELLALRWRHINLDLCSLSVVQSLYRRGEGYVIKEPKSRYSRRTVALPPSLTLLLRRRRAGQEALAGLLARPMSDDDFAFAYVDGSPLDPRSLCE